MLVLDAGALLALERNDRAMWVRYKAQLAAGGDLLSHAGVVAQVWRGGSGRQVPLARALAGVQVRALDDPLGRTAGVLLGENRTADAIDAALVLLAGDDDVIVTSDPKDIHRLVRTCGRHVDVVVV